MIGRCAEADPAVFFEANSRHEFCESLDDPLRQRSVGNLKHQVMRIFVEENRIGEVTGAARTAPWRDISERTRRRPFVEPVDESGLVAVEFLDRRLARHDEDGQAIAIPDSRIVHVPDNTNGTIEALKAGCEVAKGPRALVRVNHEML